MKQLVAVVVGLIVFGSAGAAVGQSVSSDETAIRKLIAAFDEGTQIPETADSVFFTRRHKRPRIGARGKEELWPDEEKRVSTKSKTNVRQLQIAQSGDMAYEYSDTQVTAEYKAESGKVESATFTASVLRVWKKVNGQWHMAALFALPHES